MRRGDRGTDAGCATLLGMTGSELRAWMDRYGWTVRKLGARLDRGARTVQGYVAGARDVPVIFEFAVRYLEAIGDCGDYWRLADWRDASSGLVRVADIAEPEREPFDDS